MTEAEVIEAINYVRKYNTETNMIEVKTASNVVTNEQSDTQKSQLDIEKKVLDFCIEPKSAQEIRTYLNISSKRYVAYEIIRPLINSGKLDYTNKNSINARNQKYLTVKKG